MFLHRSFREGEGIGLEIGLKIGEEIGAKKKAKETACELKKQGILSNQQIAQVTGLTIEDVEKLDC